MPMIWQTAKKASRVTVIATRKARMLVGSFCHTKPFRTSVTMLVTTMSTSTRNR